MPPPTDISSASGPAQNAAGDVRARVSAGERRKQPSLIPPSGDSNPPDLLYEALIRPHRSLARPGFFALVTVYVTLAAVPALWFLSRGAWPVTGFFGVEGLLLWGAFHLSNRERRRFEWIRLTARELIVTRGDARGRMTEWRLEPTWLRVEMLSGGGRGLRQPLLTLTSHGRRLFIGGFLAPQQKEQLAEDLRTALADRRHAPAFSRQAAD